MKQINLEQSSPEWHLFRTKTIGSSEIGTVIGVNPYETRYQLYRVKVGLDKPKDLSDNFFVQRGSRLEPFARDLANKELSSNFQPAMFVHPEYDFMSYSSDGYDRSQKALIEIKAMGLKNHNIVLETKAPIQYYIPQMQWAMAITGFNLCWFISYNPESPTPYIHLPVRANKEYQDKLVAAAIDFWRLVETKTPPDLTDSDFADVSSEMFGHLVNKYKEAKKKHDDADAELTSAKEAIKKFAGKRNIQGNGLRAFTSHRKGAIQYDKIDALKDIDLDQYRKDDSEVFYIK